MMLGPFLDVSNLPRPGLKGDLATATSVAIHSGLGIWSDISKESRRLEWQGYHRSPNTSQDWVPLTVSQTRRSHRAKSLSELKTIDAGSVHAVTTYYDSDSYD